MQYRIAYATDSIRKKFEKTLRRIPGHQQEYLLKDVENLGANPRPHGYVKLIPPPLIFSRLATYRIKIGDYRVFYDIQDSNRTVYLIAIRKRNEQTYR